MAENADAPRPSFARDMVAGLAHVAKVAWTVPAARGLVATQLIRWGLPGALVAVSMAVGEQLAR